MDPSALLNKRILIITAHPDDESYFGAGTVHANKLAGGVTNLVCATLGEKGKTHLTEPKTEDELKQIREQELRNATDISGVEQLFLLNKPDGKVNEHEQEIIDEVNKLIPQLNPDIIMSFGPDGITGHKDHMAIHRVAAKVAELHQLQFAMCCLPAEVIADAEQWLQNRRRTTGHYEENYELRPGNITIPIDGEVKLKALKCYVSQFDDDNPFSGFPESIAKTFLETESFYLKN